MKRKLITLLILLSAFSGCAEMMENQRNEDAYNATIADMKATDFFNVSNDGKIFAIRAMMYPPGKNDDKKLRKKVTQLNTEWFEKFISLNRFKTLHIDQETKDLYGTGFFVLDGTMNTYLVFDFVVFSDGLIGIKFYNWKVFGAVMTYRPNPWTRDYEQEFQSFPNNIPYQWPVIKRNFSDYFYSYKMDVINSIPD